MFSVRNRITLEADAARAWAAVRSSQFLELLLRGWMSPALFIAATGTFQQTRSNCACKNSQNTNQKTPIIIDM